MSVEENIEVVRRYLDTFNARDWDAFRECFHDDAVEEFPQSNERIVGADTIVTVLQNFEGLPTGTAGRFYGSGDHVILEEVLRYGDGSVYHAAVIFEVREGKIAKEVAYFGPTFPAPEWRAQWVEPMEPAT